MKFKVKKYIFCFLTLMILKDDLLMKNMSLKKKLLGICDSNEEDLNIFTKSIMDLCITCRQNFKSINKIIDEFKKISFNKLLFSVLLSEKIWCEEFLNLSELLKSGIKKKDLFIKNVKEITSKYTF